MVACVANARVIARAHIATPRVVSARRSIQTTSFPKPFHQSTVSTSRRASHLVRAGKVREVDEQELEVAVANREKPLIIDFFATWCGPCVLLAKELEMVAEELGDAVEILKIDCDKNEAITSALQIYGLPTLIFVSMDSSRPALRTEGLLPAQAIIDIVQKEVLAPAAE